MGAWYLLELVSPLATPPISLSNALFIIHNTHTAIIISEHVEENPKIHTQQPIVSCLVDPERFDADPDPTFQADADPDPAPDTNPFTMVIHFFSSNLQLLFPKSSKTCHV